MSKEILLIRNDDGEFELYDDTYDVVIHCKNRQGMKETCEILRKVPDDIDSAMQKVIGEFVCDKIDKIVHVGACNNDVLQLNIETPDGLWESAEALLQAACMNKASTEKYLQGRNGYCWHISDLKIYDRPRPLSDFTRLRATKFGYEPVDVERPPQSWFYVEDAECTS